MEALNREWRLLQESSDARLEAIFARIDSYFEKVGGVGWIIIERSAIGPAGSISGLKSTVMTRAIAGVQIGQADCASASSAFDPTKPTVSPAP